MSNILNSDGSPLQLSSGGFQLFSDQPDLNPEHQLLNDYDEEIIQIGGSPILYYEVLIQLQTIDQLYKEDRGKLWSPIPIQFFANYEPIGSGRYQAIFGIDSPNDEIVFECNYKAVLREIGNATGLSHPPKVGSRINTPHLGENWVILNCKLGEFKMWGAFRVFIHCKRFQESVTTGEGRITQDNSQIILNKII